MSSIEYVTIRVKQLLPVHPLIQVQVLGAEHSMLVPHWGLQVATYKFCENYKYSVCINNKYNLRRQFGIGP